MFLFHSSRFPGVGFLAMMVAVIASWAEVADADQLLYIPYNGMDADKFGANAPYTDTDPLRQHLHVYQLPSEKPTPVYFFAHADGKDAAVSKQGLKTVASAGYSVISWESVTTISPENPEVCSKDFELVWSWFKANAAKYNLDPNSVIVGGKARGARCSWPLAYSGKPEIKGLYMFNALGQDAAWGEEFQKGSSTIWEQAITKKAPPAYLLYGTECPKPITQDCEYISRRGKTIVDAYANLGIESRIQLIDGVANLGSGTMGLFPDFVSSLSSFSYPASNSLSAGKGSSIGSSGATAGSSSAGKSASSTSSGGGGSSTTATTTTTTTRSKLNKSTSSASVDEKESTGVYVVFFVVGSCLLAFFGIEKHNEPKKIPKFIDDGDLNMTEMGKSSYSDNPDKLKGTYKDEPGAETKEKRRKKKRKKPRKKRDETIDSASSRGEFDF